jgi:cryptochrome
LLQHSVNDNDKTIGGRIPSLQELGFDSGKSLYTGNWVGGETEALSQLSSFCSRRTGQSDEPISWLMSRDSLSPYIRFGCVSVCQVFSQLHQYASTSTKGQVLFSEITKNLLMREFSFIVGISTPRFDIMKGNPLCIQLPWEENLEYLTAWRNGRTGYPWIDAAMRQIHQEGWAHYIARQSIAVFLTRGYLWINWERGKEFFQEFMLDFELPLSTVCWMQSSCSGFFCDFIESYDPCFIGKQMDPEGHYVKVFIPELRDFPSDFIHTPWLAPDHIQQQANCIIGKDYPKPIVDTCQRGELCCQRIRSIMSALKDLYGDSSL